MNRILWWVADLVSQTLESDERQAVRGDLAESGETGAQALRDVFGLVVRRQIALWTEWQTWFVLAGLILPLGMLLSLLSRLVSGGTAVYIWLYANNWDWAFFKNAGFWYVFAESSITVLKMFLKLVCWSWTAGFVLGWISRKTKVRINGVLFCLMLLFGVVVGAPQYFAYYWEHLHRTFATSAHSDPNAPVFALLFYRVIFRLIVQAVLVAVPSVLGMLEGADLERLGPVARLLLWTAAIATLGSMVVQVPGFGLLLKAWRPWVGLAWQIRPLHFFVYWPIAYYVAKILARQWQRSRHFTQVPESHLL